MVASHHTGNRPSQTDKPGTNPCGNCNYCRFILRGDSTGLPKGTSWTPRYRVTCQSVGAVYITKCHCGTFYVGKTKRPLFCRISDHVSAISKRKMETPISRHMGLYHNHNLTMIGFFVLEHIPPHDRGGDIDKQLLQLEAKWISRPEWGHQLQTLSIAPDSSFMSIQLTQTLVPQVWTFFRMPLPPYHSQPWRCVVILDPIVNHYWDSPLNPLFGILSQDWDLVAILNVCLYCTVTAMSILL